MQPVNKTTAVLLGLLTSGFVAAARPEYTIDNTVNTFQPDKVTKTDRGYQYWFADPEFADGNTLKLSVVLPGAKPAEPHTHPQDEFFFVLEGTAEFFLNGETKTGGPMTSFYCPPGSLHGIRNAGDSELKYLVIENYKLAK
jgi:quercetin dioxygenase-like cupin family protein